MELRTITAKDIHDARLHAHAAGAFVDLNSEGADHDYGSHASAANAQEVLEGQTGHAAETQPTALQLSEAQAAVDGLHLQHGPTGGAKPDVR